MTDDFRLTVDFDDEADGADLLERLAALRFAAHERDRFGERVIVSRSGACVYFYTDSEERGREVEVVVGRVLAGQGTPARIVLERWHPVAQSWEDASLPLPETGAELEAERERQAAREARESRRTGHAEWEVRVELPDHESTLALADRLETEGVSVVRRHTFLLVGAVNEEQARALAERLEGEAPEGAEIHVEPGGEMVWEVTPQSPFAFLGGLGG